MRTCIKRTPEEVVPIAYGEHLLKKLPRANAVCATEILAKLLHEVRTTEGLVHERLQNAIVGSNVECAEAALCDLAELKSSPLGDANELYASTHVLFGANCFDCPMGHTEEYNSKALLHRRL
jgi:hypothetical protein